MKELQTIKPISIKDKIYTIRNMQIMLDEDLASLYQVQTKVLLQSVKRNSERFPREFCFRISKQEYTNLMSQIVTSSLENSENRTIQQSNLRSQIVTSSSYRGRRYLPFVFTEQGVAMLIICLDLFVHICPHNLVV